MAKGHVVAQSHDTSKSLWLGPLLFQSLILGCIKLSLLEVRLWNQQCNEDGNEYLLLDLLIDYHKSTR